MAKLNVTQRRYILQTLLETKKKQIHDEYSKTAESLLSLSHGYSIRVIMQDSGDICNYHLSVITGYKLHSDTCNNLDEEARDYVDAVAPSTAWYKSEYEKDNFEVFTTFEGCMTRPKVEIVFTNEKRELARLRKKAKKDFVSEYHKLTDLVSELRYDVMEFNKWLKESMSDIMLSDDGKTLLTNLLKSMP